MSSAPGDPPLAERLRHRLAFWSHRLLRQDYRLTLRPFGEPVTFVISTRREFNRATAVSYEGAFLQRILAHLRSGDTFFDVGANIGLVSLVVARHPSFSGGAVHAFEPEPRNFAHLQRNLAANQLGPRASAHPIALSHEEGTANLFVRGETGDGRHSLVAAQGSTGSISVEVKTMTTFCVGKNVFPSVIKIDVEGAEGDVLQGMDGLLGRHRPRELFMEIHNKGGEDRMPGGESIDDWLTARGFSRVWEERRGRGRHRHYRDTSAL